MACDVVLLPLVEADLCAPDLNFAEIDTVYLGNLGNPLTDWGDLAEWNTLLDNSALADATKIRFLHVVGSKPRPERNKVEYSQNRVVYTTPKHTVSLKVDETGDGNYALVKFLEDNAGQKVAFWYQAGKYLYGGNSGIEALLVLDDVIGENNEELNVFEGSAEWEGSHPERIINPMA